MDYTVEYLCWQALTGSISVDQTSSYAADVSKIKVEATYPITKTTITDGYRLDTAADTFFTEGMQEMRDADYGGFGDLLGHCYGNGKVFNGLY
ncbi:MAG: hypothetical protein GWN00_18790, partial [Aliifodinibius sp.]|nr:hypothetical protein [Phycisphaerae bacterium]NIR64899.1 hypothetical protein [candidate division Zixibacteria bacterium]NIT58196.1 hypothetical protein [Fodinibius sp.]NIU14834.1 hypothetical protein [candidate division Zixibacteria bacterium]NIX02153.1 hypothetical protein [Phycisphaerae bacterium]